MRNVILNQAEQITHSLAINKDVRVEGKFDQIVLAGMGGSGHPGDLINSLRLTKAPLTVHRNYGLPKIYGKKPLIIPSSYSGNTEEALSAYQEAQNEGYTLMVNTAGGTLAEWCQRDGTPLVKIDFPGMQPRHTLLASFTGLAAALQNSGLAEDITADLTRVADVLEKDLPGLEEPSQELAQKIAGTVPIITASQTLAFAAQNFKIQINENSKTPAFWNTFPELNHNEMVGFSQIAKVLPNDKFHVLIIRDNDDHPRVKARMDVTAELYAQWGLAVSNHTVTGQTLFEKIAHAVGLGMWTSYYLALAYKVDPMPVAGVENFKARLKEVAGEIR